MNNGYSQFIRLGGALLLALQLAACGGGGSSSGGNNNGGGDSGITDQESRQKAAAAVVAAGGVVEDAQANATEEPEAPTTTSTSGTPQTKMTTKSVDSDALVMDCTQDPLNGQGAMYQYSLSADDPDPQTHYQGQPAEGITDGTDTVGLDTVMTDGALFNGSLSSASGTFQAQQMRGNCEGAMQGTAFTSQGAFDAIIYDGVDGNEDNTVSFNRLGGLDNGSLDPVNPPDLSNYNTSGSGSDLMRMRGLMRVCTGCTGDLSTFTGNPEDAAVSMYTRMSPSNSDNGRLVELGEGPDAPFSMISRADRPAAGQTETELSGRIASPGNGGSDCDFDVTYETVNPLVRDQGVDGPEALVAGTLKVTVEGSGETHTVEVSNGTVLVDGEEQDVTDLACDS